jgi:two-component system invasion response regulator UvrY
VLIFFVLRIILLLLQDFKPNTVNILIVDGDADIRTSLAQLLGKKYTAVNIKELVSGKELIDTISSRRWDIIISELALPGFSAAEIMHIIKRFAPGIPLLIFSIYPAEQYAISAIQKGASCYLSKAGTTMEETMHAIDCVQTGKRYLTSQVADLLIRSVKTGKLRRQK